MLEKGLTWYELQELYANKLRTPLTITFAFVATHNHFVLDRGGKVFNRSAPIIKLPESTTEDDHLALLAYLNSSTACFWMKQVIHNKTNASQKHSTDPARAAYEFAGTALEALPCISLPDVAAPVRELLQIGEARSRWVSGADLEAEGDRVLSSRESFEEWLRDGWRRYDDLTARAVYLQEELDWLVYERAGFLAESEAQVTFDATGAAAPGTRPFEVSQGYDSGVSARARRSEEAAVAGTMPEQWRCRLALLNRETVSVFEDRSFKRMWRLTEQNVDQAEYRVAQPREWVTAHILERLEGAVQGQRAIPAREVARAVSGRPLEVAAELLGDPSGAAMVKRLLTDEAVPYLSIWTFTDTGLEKRSAWEAVWAAQRAEDRGESTAQIPIPPQYSQGSRGKSTDFREASYWRLRGKLDVPKERFISYPGCESDEDKEPVYGWAGWDHLQRAQALAALYQDRKTREGWPRERLTPLLAGLLELIPWVKQWNNEPSEEFGGLKLGDYFEAYLKGECVELGLTEDDLRSWRPPAKGRGGKTAAKAAAPKAEGGKKARGRKRKAAAGETEGEG